MAWPFDKKKKENEVRRPYGEEDERAKWWGDMYQMRFVVTAGIAVFVFLTWNFPDHMKYLPTGLAFMVVVWWLSTKA
jgi:hypothetical protein